jgi:biopolymer transport protein ExbB/TolQ
MIQTQETLYIVLSVAIVCVTVFLCWALYELATFLRRSNRIVDEVERKVQHVQESLSNIKDRFEQVAGYASKEERRLHRFYIVIKRKRLNRKRNQNVERKVDYLMRRDNVKHFLKNIYTKSFTYAERIVF